MPHLLVHVIEGKELHTHGSKAPDTYPMVILNDYRAKGKQALQAHTSNPKWNIYFDIHFDSPNVSSEHLEIEVFQPKTFGKDASLGCARISLETIETGQEQSQWVSLHPRSNKETITTQESMGQIHIGLRALDFGMMRGGNVTSFPTMAIPVDHVTMNNNNAMNDTINDKGKSDHDFGNNYGKPSFSPSSTNTIPTGIPVGSNGGGYYTNYNQPTYGQPTYNQSTYGQAAYGQQPIYGGAGVYIAQPYPPPYVVIEEPEAKHKKPKTKAQKRKKTAIKVLKIVGLIVVGVVAIFFLGTAFN